ncbi:MAG: hypothetical protein CL917_14330 [Deltaproteobacteria bacterium]|nr:hypothetical protein [Deltaproteobacteria bacterium]
MNPLPAITQLIKDVRAQGFFAKLGPAGSGMADPGWLSVTGRDALEFMHSQVTNDVTGLQPGEGNASARVNRQGQLLELFHLHRLPQPMGEDALGFLLPRTRIAQLMSLFEDAIFADDVHLEDQSESWEWWALQGTSAGSVLDHLWPIDQEEWASLPENASRFLSEPSDDTPPLLLRCSLAGDGGFLVGFPKPLKAAASQIDALSRASLEAGLIHLEEPALSEVLDSLRIEAGVVQMGSDTVGRKRILPETGLEQFTVSYTKGCYLGQEVIARVRTYGALPYSLRGLVLTSADLDSEGILLNLPKAGERILLSDGSKVGQWGSRTFSTHRESAVAYAYLDKTHRTPGAELDLFVSERRVSAEVVLLPFYRAPDQGDRVDWLYDRAVRDFAQGREADALTGLEEALRIDPSFSDGYEAMGVIFGRSDRFHEAIDVFKRLEEIAPDEPMVNTNLSLYFMKLGDKETAEAESAKAMQKDMAKASGRRIDDEALEHALVEQKRSDALRKKEMFGQILEIDPEDGIALFGIGNALAILEDWDGAVGAYSSAAEVDPENSAVHLAHGKALEKLLRFKEALSVYRLGMEVASRKGDLMPLGEMEHRALLLSTSENRS